MDIGFFLWALLQARPLVSVSEWDSLVIQLNDAIAADFIGHDAVAFLAACGVQNGIAVAIQGLSSCDKLSLDVAA